MGDPAAVRPGRDAAIDRDGAGCGGPAEDPVQGLGAVRPRQSTVDLNHRTLMTPLIDHRVIIRNGRASLNADQLPPRPENTPCALTGRVVLKDVQV